MAKRGVYVGMKTPLLCAAFALAFSTAVLAQTTTNTPPANCANNGEGARYEKLKAALEQLDLTDAQKAQIKQIRETVTDKKDRRRQIFAVLTPDQKQKLLQMIQEHREASQSGASSSGT